MNKGQGRNAGSGSLMGHVNYDAGLMRYRQLMSRSHQEVAEPKQKAERVGRVRRARKVAPIAAAVILVLSIGVAGIAQGNCLRLCPGVGGSVGSYSILSPSSAQYAKGELAIEAAAWGGGGASCFVAQCGGFSQFIP